MKRWRIVWSAVVAVLALALVGCGGGQSAEQKAAEHKAQLVAAAKARQAASQADFRRYLARTRVANGYYQRGRSIANRTIDAMVSVTVDSAQGRAAGVAMKKAARNSSEASVRQRVTKPPLALRGINIRFAQDMEKIAVWQDEMGGALRSGDAITYNATVGSSGDIGRSVRAEWRAQVAALARELGVPMPKWAAKIGTVD